MDEEELEQIKKESMAGLFMAFKIGGQKEPKPPKAAPKKPKRDDGISEDSMEDMVSQDLNGSIDGENQ